MQYWLLKSEPVKYSWDQFKKDKRTGWDGVRNYQAANFLRAMKIGDRAFFYHSNEGMEIVGLAEIAREAYPDPSDEKGKFVMVDVKPLAPAITPLTLAAIKQDKDLQNMQFVKQSRLSVSPVTAAEFKKICKLTGIAV